METFVKPIKMSCFMNMINDYLLKGPSCHAVSKFFMCISAPSWSSDTALQVTCMVR